MMAIRLQTPAAGGDTERVARCQDVSSGAAPVPPGLAEPPWYGTATQPAAPPSACLAARESRPACQLRPAGRSGCAIFGP